MPGIVNFFRSLLARVVFQIDDADEAAAALAKETERKARENARSKRRREETKRRKSPPYQPLIPTADSEIESADSPKTPEISAHPPPPQAGEGASLSLLQNLDLKEGEKGKGGTGERGPPGPLPPDWEPDAEVREIAVERLGEIGAVNLIANFREHYSDDPRLLTPRQWRRLFRDTWVKREWPNSPRLPLMQVATTTALPAAQLPRADDPVWAPVYKRLEAELGAAVASSWFSRARLASIDGDVATVTLPTGFLVDWIKARHGDLVSRCVSAEHAEVTRVNFAVAAAPAKEAS